MVARNQRMTALGELAGGIAHDFNNVMQSVAGSGELIGAHAADANRVSELCARLMQAAARGSSISRRLLAFSRQDALSAEPVDVEVLFEEAKDLLGHTLGSGTALRMQIDQDVHRLVADRLQLETVLVNLATNARDAMPDGGTLTLRAARDTRSEDAADPPLKSGPYIRLSVEDSGIGMDAETLSHAPDPFFTTKPKGQGTGLGLSMAKGFAEQSGGGFAMASQPGQGTVVTLWLPETLAPAVRPDPVMAMPDGAAWGGTHILFVDDDDLLRQTMVAALESAGFKTSGARDAGEALEYFAGAPRVDALIADFSMPGMNGRELIRAVHARQPDVPAILLTGQMGEPADLAEEPPQAGRFVLMRKPVRGRDLVSCVQSLLQAAN
jgi:CheY-like chemotaxis protein/anti-sigma regulatory factor (Ser/Thr protein kinase)